MIWQKLWRRLMQIELSRDDILAVLLNRITELDPEEVREELYHFYSETVYPKMDDKQLAEEFYDKIVSSITEEEEEESYEEPCHPN